MNRRPPFRGIRSRRPSHTAPLSNMQKARLCIVAREAYDSIIEPGLSFEEWRHEEQIAACGKPSLRECVQLDYKALEAHFLAIAGDTGRAFKSAMKSQVEERNLAMFKLRENCRERGLDMAYPASICRRQFKCSLDEASAKQLWNLVFTVRTRRTPAASAVPAMGAADDNNEPF